MNKPIEFRLGKVEQRTIHAVAAELGRLQTALQETDAALRDLAERYAQDQGYMPEEYEIRFDQRGEKIVLLVTPREQESAGPEDPAPEEK